MAIEVPKEKKNHSLLWLGIIILILVAAYFAWRLFFPSSKIISEPDMTKLVGPTTQQVQKLELDINQVINHPVFQTLKSHLLSPLTTGPLGRTNPFLPF